MRLLVLVLITPFVPLILIILKNIRSPRQMKIWFSEYYGYFKKLICSSVLVYGLILLAFITAYSIIKPLDLKALITVDVHLKMFTAAWILSFMNIGFYESLPNN